MIPNEEFRIYDLQKNTRYVCKLLETGEEIGGIWKGIFFHADNGQKYTYSYIEFLRNEKTGEKVKSYMTTELEITKKYSNRS